MICPNCSYNEEGGTPFVGIFALGIKFLTTDKKDCCLFGCPKCGTVQFTTDDNYIQKKKMEYKQSQ